MKIFDAGALRRAMARHGHADPAAANELVQRTLAQHGLSTGPLAVPTGGPSGTPSPGRAVFSCAAGSREYLLHVPDTAKDSAAGLVLMLHGCTQTPEDFATGTRIAAHADAHGLVVVAPAQARGANAQSCWNWFSKGDQRRERGEPAILAGLVQDISARHGVPADRVFVAGLSAGAAMAVILGRSYPEVFSGVGAHSGLPYGCAADVPQAFAAMRGESAQNAPAGDRAVPTIVFHGSADATVVPANGARIVADALVPAHGAQVQTVTEGQANGRSYRQEATLGSDGRVLAEHWTIDGLGHAWSGGDRAGSFADPGGPDASAEMIRFFLSLRND